MVSAALVSLSRVGLGSARVGSGRLHWTMARLCTLLDTAWQAGITYVDTADSYNSGRAEEMIGNALRETRLPFTVMTKAGFTYVRLPRPFAALNNRAQWLLHRLGHEENYDPHRIARCLDQSLRRLRRDQVDVFFLHRPSLEDVQNDRLLAVLTRMTQSGKARAIGLSSEHHAVIGHGLGTGVFQILQTAVHPTMSNDVRARTAAWANQRGAVIGHSVARWTAEESTGRAAVADVHARVAASGLSPTAWSIRQALRTPGVSSILTGTVNPDHLRANVLAAETPEVWGIP
jgi:aryl-alcohol dehydrogenase-like predicted oxidoreductase